MALCDIADIRALKASMLMKNRRKRKKVETVRGGDTAALLLGCSQESQQCLFSSKLHLFHTSGGH
jgi:hypothetical protein